LSQLASTHAHETLLWASKGKGVRHTFNYDLINSLDPDDQVSSVWRIPAVSRREKLRVLFVGRRAPQKGVGTLVAAAGLLEDQSAQPR
jgi:hypothetical protein